MKLIEQYGLRGIDKAEIDELIAAQNFIGLNHTSREEKVIVSLTSYKPRIHDVKYTIYSLLNQTLPPDKLILWLDEDSFPQREQNLPPDLLKLKAFGLSIDWGENLRSYKKLIPALEKYPDAIIVTADDDLFYQPDWLKILYAEHLDNPDCVIAHRAHHLRLNTHGEIYPYKSWQFEVNSRMPQFRNFFTSGAGTLFKKEFFHSDVLRRDIFNELVPFADDIWFWTMTVLNGTKIKIPQDALKQLIYVDIDTQLGGETLWAENEIRNDTYIQRVIEKYPALLDALIREDVEATPYLSVVLVIENVDQLNDCLDNILAQSFFDFELIIINRGSRTDINSPTNFKIINYPGGSEQDALKLGLRKAAGEYVLFKDAESILIWNALEFIAQVSNASKADVIHFTGHIDDEKFISDDTLNFDEDAPIFFDEPKQTLALLWLQGKLNGRLDTKIFRRQFLIENDINFEGDLAEFLFKALIQAEKYLLVPQAFCLIKD